MAEYICNMNRLDWAGNKAGCIRMGGRFALDDNERANTLLDAGYISEVPVEMPDPTPPLQIGDTGDITDDPDSTDCTTNAIPSISWTAADIKTWLDNRNIEYTERAVKTELLELVALAE